MTLRKYTFNTGSGAVTAAGGAEDDALAAVAGLTYDNTVGIIGQGAVSAADTAGSARMSFPNCTALASRMCFVMPPAGTDCRIIFHGYGGATPTRVSSMSIHSTGRLRVYDKSSTSVQKWSSAAILTPGLKYVAELVSILGATAGAGTLKISYREFEQAEAEGTTLTNQTLEANTVPFDTAQMCKLTTVAGLAIKFDELAWNDGSSDLIGPPVAPVIPPTINVFQDSDLAEVDVRGSVAGDGVSPLTYDINPKPTGLKTLASGWWLIPQLTTAQNLTVTVTQAGVNYTQVVTIPAIAEQGARTYLPSFLVKTS